jgi:hypothetical protein
MLMADELVISPHIQYRRHGRVDLKYLTYTAIVYSTKSCIPKVVIDLSMIEKVVSFGPMLVSPMIMIKRACLQNCHDDPLLMIPFFTRS